MKNFLTATHTVSPTLKETSIHISMTARRSTAVGVTATALPQYHKKLLRINFYNSHYPSSQSRHTAAERRGLFF